MRAKNQFPIGSYGLLAAAVAMGVLSAGCKPAGAAAPHSGQVLYASCSTCHGPTGEGNPSIAAPAIAGLPQWYLEAQLKKFRTGLRGAHPDDAEGLRMRPMSRQLDNDAEVRVVSEFVSKLPAGKIAPRLTGGDVEAGKALYATCIACHGVDGKGNPALKSPPLVGQSDWYLLAQLHKFKGGIRGTAPGDDSGAQMRPMSMTLADEQAMKNVLAYVATLPQ